MRRYASEASGRWIGFEHRSGDIVISTRSKCGTTWLQMICLLLIIGDTDLPAPLAQLSPWLDWDIEPLEDVRRRLDRQEHRRVIKTHTPLDGFPLRPDVTYLVIGRHPLDVAVSLYHHSHNLDRDRMEALTGRRSSASTLPIEAWLPGWIDPADGLDAQLDTMPGLVHHLADAWRRSHQANVVLLHYRDLSDDLDGQMRRLAGTLGIDVEAHRWADLVAAASFDAMKRRADQLAPDHLGVLRDRDAFFRRGSSGEGQALLSEEGRRRYVARLDEVDAPEMVAWLHC